MDGRTSLLVLLGLGLVSSGCVTTGENKAPARSDSEPLFSAVPVKDDVTRPTPPRVLGAFAEMKEREADLAKDTPEIQARLRDEARRAYQEMLKAEPDNIDAARGLARVYASMGNYDRAREAYTKALSRHPRDVNLWYDYGMMFDRKRDWAEGAKCFKKALEIDPENQRSLKAMGFTLARAGQFDQSVTYLTRAMGSAAAAHVNVAQMLLHVGGQETGDQRAQHEAMARQHLQVALKENPGYDRARELLESLDAHPNVTHGTVDLQFERQ
jgi:Tfp pilus assembly protein PilF